VIGELERRVTLDNMKVETLNLDNELGKSHGKVQKAVKGVKGPVDRVLAEIPEGIQGAASAQQKGI
jgi:hypothetical protein